VGVADDERRRGLCEVSDEKRSEKESLKFKLPASAMLDSMALKRRRLRSLNWSMHLVCLRRILHDTKLQRLIVNHKNKSPGFLHYVIFLLGMPVRMKQMK